MKLSVLIDTKSFASLSFQICLYLLIELKNQSVASRTSRRYDLQRKTIPIPKSCKVGSRHGTCLFVWECIKKDGVHLGICSEGFMFGSCCGHDTKSNSVMQEDVAEPSPATPTEKTAPPQHETNWTMLHALATIVTARPLFVRPANSVQHFLVQSPLSVNLAAAAAAAAHHRNGTHAAGTSVLNNPFARPSLITRLPFRPTRRPRPTPHRSPPSFSVPIGTAKPIEDETVSTTSQPIKDETVSTTSQLHAEESSASVQIGTLTSTSDPPRMEGNSASIRKTSFFGFTTTHRCGGALINERWVATAAHCVINLVKEQIRVRVGEYDFSNALEPYPHVERLISRKVIHPSFNETTYENDLALLRLDDAVKFMPNVYPVCLPGNDDLLIGQKATITGWGRLSSGGTLPSILQQVQVPVMSNRRCEEMFLKSGRLEYIPDIFICAGYETGGRDACQIQGKNGRWFLAGIISWGIGCADPFLPGVCTRISKFRDYILSVVK